MIRDGADVDSHFVLEIRDFEDGKVDALGAVGAVW